MGLERRLGRQGSFHVSRRVQTISTFLAYLMMGTPGVSFAEEAAAPIQGEAVPSGNQGEEEEQGKDQGQKKEGGASGYTPQDLEGIEVKLYRKPEKLPGDYSLEIEQVVQGKRNPWGMEAGVRVLSVAGYSGQLIIPEAAGTLHLDDLDPAYFRLSAGKVFHHGARRNAEVAHPVELLGYQDNGSFGTETFERFSYSQLDLNFGRPEALRFTAGGGGIFDLTGSLQATVE
ncbi:hypothetical protein HYT52_03790, partial [Candidatus Woesearchaeota archaeon]|nr:hypothetical protein [Candidatus Woesearchaeota archaeon]